MRTSGAARLSPPATPSPHDDTPTASAAPASHTATPNRPRVKRWTVRFTIRALPPIWRSNTIASVQTHIAVPLMSPEALSCDDYAWLPVRRSVLFGDSLRILLGGQYRPPARPGTPLTPREHRAHPLGSNASPPRNASRCSSSLRMASSSKRKYDRGGSTPHALEA